MKIWLRTTLKKVFDFALEVIFPKNCIGCGTAGALLCADCKSTISPAPAQTYSNTFAACAYKGLVQKIFVSIKLRKESRYVSVLGNLLIETIRQNPKLQEIIARSEITYIPMHWMKRNIRGFNQSELLAKQIAKSFDKTPVAILKRSKLGSRQSALGKNARLENTRDLFRISSQNIRLDGKDIVLIDDIRTTGATLAAARQVLLDAGANSVFNLVVAQD
jgi:ComF family protein